MKKNYGRTNNMLISITSKLSEFQLVNPSLPLIIIYSNKILFSTRSMFNMQQDVFYL